MSVFTPATRAMIEDRAGSCDVFGEMLEGGAGTADS